ncbi:MAG: hypothetical protein HY075_05275 [Deltaproteobacteria bacterium]|nr:hypothetical protein [Deltaproteobacteria bacterium]
MIVTKESYLKREVELRKNAPSSIELVSESSLALSSIAVGDPKASNGAFVYGELVSPAGEQVDGLKVEVAGGAPVSPIYVDDNGIPNRELATTGARGQFMLLNLAPGTYLVTVTDALGRERAPHVVYVGQHEGIVRKFSLGAQSFVRGRIFNATANGAAVDGAQIQLLGSQKTAMSASDGRFVLGPLYVDCSSLNYVQVEKTGFYRNRVDYACSGADEPEHSIYVFPAAHVDGIAADAGTRLSPSTGVIVGHASFNQPVKMQLWGPEETQPDNGGRGNDYYFDADGVINAQRDRTSTNGNFGIINTPEGISYIQAFDSNGRTLSYWPIFTSASTVNAYVQ